MAKANQKLSNAAQVAKRALEVAQHDLRCAESVLLILRESPLDDVSQGVVAAASKLISDARLSVSHCEFHTQRLP